MTWNEDIREGQTPEGAKKTCMDATFRTEEVLAWNCHNQHGNQVRLKNTSWEVLYCITSFAVERLQTDAGENNS